MSEARIPDASSTLSEFEAFAPPDLKHAKLIAVSFNGKEIEQPTWNKLVHAAIAGAVKAVGDLLSVQKISGANVVEGRRNDAGFRYVAASDLSVQGQDSNNAWRSVSCIPRDLKVPVEVSFVWQKDSQRPEKHGIMRIHG